MAIFNIFLYSEGVIYMITGIGFISVGFGIMITLLSFDLKLDIFHKSFFVLAGILLTAFSLYFSMNYKNDNPYR